MSLITELTIEIETASGPITRVFAFARQTVLEHTLAELSDLGFVKVISVEKRLLPVIEHPQDLLTLIGDTVSIFEKSEAA